MKDKESFKPLISDFLCYLYYPERFRAWNGSQFNFISKVFNRLVRKLVKPSSSGLREFRTQARIYSKIRVGNSY
jgi:hypothetical protein